MVSKQEPLPDAAEPVANASMPSAGSVAHTAPSASVTGQVADVAVPLANATQIVFAGMPLAAAAKAVAAQLAAAGCPDASFDAADLCLLATGQQLRLAVEYLLSAEQAEQLNAYATRRAAREPLQYIWGRWPFLNFELAVGEGVLCPRADTEIVTEHAAHCLRAVQAAHDAAQQPSEERAAQGAVQDTVQRASGKTQSACGAVQATSSKQAAQDTVQGASSKTPPTVLELCGGSGCIGLGVKMFCPTAQVTVLEKSPDALPYLRENANHALDEIAAKSALIAPYVQVVEGDLFTYHATLPDEAFDLLVSNPPYLTAQEMAQLQPEVAREPAMALAAGQDGLDFYRAIARDYKRVVKRGGALVLEIGCAQAAAVMQLLAEAGWQEITCKQDYGKNDRCVTARHNAVRS